MTGELVISGLGVLISIGASLSAVAFFLGKAKSKQDGQSKEIAEIKVAIGNDKVVLAAQIDKLDQSIGQRLDKIDNTFTDIFKIIREGGLHPLCTQQENIGSMKSQIQNTTARVDKLEERIIVFLEKFGAAIEKHNAG